MAAITVAARLMLHDDGHYAHYLDQSAKDRASILAKVRAFKIPEGAFQDCPDVRVSWQDDIVRIEWDARRAAKVVDALRDRQFEEQLRKMIDALELFRDAAADTYLEGDVGVFAPSKPAQRFEPVFEDIELHVKYSEYWDKAPAVAKAKAARRVRPSPSAR